MNKFPITAIVLTFNEEEMLANCLQTLQWCQEIIVVDSGSTDQTTDIARRFGAEVLIDDSNSFAYRRNHGLKSASQKYVIYVDADERVTPQLAQEIMVNLETKTASVLKLRRENVFYGHKMMAGGWQNDVLARVFDKSVITTWQGDVHESPQFLGTAKTLSSPLIHLTHRSVRDGLIKTIVWTELESRLLAESQRVKSGPLTVLRKMTFEFIRRYVWFGGYKDGSVGFMEAVIQAINKALIYIQVWERKAQTDIRSGYEKMERDINSAWQNEEIK